MLNQFKSNYFVFLSEKIEQSKITAINRKFNYISKKWKKFQVQQAPLNGTLCDRKKLIAVTD